MLPYYFKTAWRNLRRSKGYAAVNILGLTLGIIACLAIFLIVRFETGFDTFRSGAERIYRVTSHVTVAGSEYEYGYVPAPFVAQAGEMLGGAAEVAGFFNYYARVTVPRAGMAPLQIDMPAREAVSTVIIAQPAYFNVFEYEWLAGGPANALSGPFRVVLTDIAARRYFGNEPFMKLPGRQLIYNDSLRVTVSGIVKAPRQNTDLAFSDFISFASIPHSFLKTEIDLRNWRTWESRAQVFIKLPPQSAPGRVSALLPGLVKAHFQVEAADKVQLRLQPLRDLHFDSRYTDVYVRKAHLPTLRMLSVIAGFILLIAAVNYANLSAAQAGKRERSAGIRKIMGSSRGGLMVHALSETVIVTVIAIVLAALLVNPVLSLFDAFLPEGIRLGLFHYAAWLFFGGIGLLTVLLAGIYPAWVQSAPGAVTALAGGAEQHRRFRGFLGKALITFQFIIALVFITGVLVVDGQLRFMLQKDLGFDQENIVSVAMPRDGYTPEAGRRFAEKLEQVPGVALVSLHRGVPLSARHGNTSIKMKAGTHELMAAFEFCDENMLPLYGMQLAAGRNLLPSDTMREFLINETCARQLGFNRPQDAVGQLVQVGIGGKSGPVAGVVRDFNNASLHSAIQPFFMTTNARASRTVGIRLLPGGKAALDGISQAWNAVFQDAPFAYTFFDETIAGYYATEQKTRTLMRFAMFAAILISAIGLFGMAALTATHRTKEIGIRKVLGASVGNIAARFMFEFTKPVMIAICIAAPVAWFTMQRWLQNFPFRIHMGWQIFLLAGVAGIAIALLTLCFQAVKSATLNPVKHLRAHA